MTKTLIALMALTIAVTPVQAKGAKFKDLTPDLQQIIVQEVGKLSRDQLIAMYLKKATPKDLLELLNETGRVRAVQTPRAEQ